MNKARRWGPLLVVLLTVTVASFSFAQGGAHSLKCVGIYSETDDGHVSYKVGTGDWVLINVGDVVPAGAQIRVNVAQDWIEFTPSNNPAKVFKISGSDSGDVIQAVSDLLQGQSRTVSFPQPQGGSPDPQFANKLVVTQYNSRDIYDGPGADDQDIQYGDILDASGTVNIIAINTTVTLERADGKVVTVIGPLKFSVDKAMTGQQLYKFLNVQ